MVYLLLLCQMRYINSMSGGIPWPQTGATQYHARLGLPDKGRAIRGLVVLGSTAFGPDKRSGPRLLSTVTSGINRIMGSTTHFWFRTLSRDNNWTEKDLFLTSMSFAQ